MTSQNVALWDINKALWVIFLFIVTKIFQLWKMTYLSFNWHNSATSLIFFYAVFGKMVLFGNTISILQLYWNNKIFVIWALRFYDTE